jgi:hypothetical protein
MGRRTSRARDDYEEESARTPRRKAKAKGGGGAGVVLLVAVIGLVLLLGAAGAVGAVLYVKLTARPSAPADGPGPVAQKGEQRGDPKAELAAPFVGPERAARPSGRR